MYGSYYGEFRPELDIDPPLRQRRLTVLLRLLLLIPHFIVLFVLGIVTFFAAIVAWFGALVLGRLPRWAESYLGGYIRYATCVYASLYLLIDTYPPFSFEGDRRFPVRVEFRPGNLNVLAVLFRIILVIPAAIISGLAAAGWGALAFFCWLVVLILGKNPAPLFEASAAILRYSMRTDAYFLMLTPAYPKGLFGDRDTGVRDTGIRDTGIRDTGIREPGGREPGETTSATRPLRLSIAGRVLLGIFLLAGLASWITSGESSDSSSGNGRQSSYAIHATRQLGPDRLAPGVRRDDAGRVLIRHVSR